MFPSATCTRVHIDFLGPVNGHMYFVVVDAYSKVPEVVNMKSITSSSTIRALRKIFSRHVILKSIVSDNGQQFISSELAKTMVYHTLQRLSINHQRMVNAKELYKL